MLNTYFFILQLILTTFQLKITFLGFTPFSKIIIIYYKDFFTLLKYLKKNKFHQFCFAFKIEGLNL